MRNFNITLAASGTLEDGAKIQYLRTLVRGEALRKFDLFTDDMEGMNPLTVETIILGLYSYFFPVNSLSKQKCAMHRGIRNPRGFKLRQYVAHLIDLNKYFYFFPGATISGKKLI